MKLNLIIVSNVHLNVARMLLKTRMESREIKRGINLGRLSFSLNCHIGHKR